MTRAGEELFRKYATAPNSLGYCGPVDWDGKDVRAFAAKFDGAWAYQQVIAELFDGDPLDEEVVRTYWVGTERGDQIDRGIFFTSLLERIGKRAGPYWTHLTEESLAEEATPSHAFHVLGVYPWSRLLSTGMPEPLEVINNCLLLPGLVDGGGTVQFHRLGYTPRGGLHFEASLGPSCDEPPGTNVLLHWGTVCDVVKEDEALALRRRLEGQVELTNRRLRGR